MISIKGNRLECVIQNQNKIILDNIQKLLTIILIEKFVIHLYQIKIWLLRSFSSSMCVFWIVFEEFIIVCRMTGCVRESEVRNNNKNNEN